jgi:hypothetical protein
MTTIKDLIRETEKRLEVIMQNVLNNENALRQQGSPILTKDHSRVIIAFKNASKLERKELSALKQYQTIADENIKKAKELLDDCMSGGCDREMVLKQFDEIFKEQLNPAQTEDEKD